VLAFARPEALREVIELQFEDRLYQCDKGFLQHLVFDREHTDWPGFSRSLWYFRSLHRLCPVFFPPDAVEQFLDVSSQIFAVVGFGQVVHSGALTSV
jgi:hypothetical protein